MSLDIRCWRKCFRRPEYEWHIIVDCDVLNCCRSDKVLVESCVTPRLSNFKREKKGWEFYGPKDDPFCVCPKCAQRGPGLCVGQILAAVYSIKPNDAGMISRQSVMDLLSPPGIRRDRWKHVNAVR